MMDLESNDYPDVSPGQLLKDHEKRIVRLEKSDERTQRVLEELRDSLKVSDIRSEERSKMMISQNEGLMKQNERQSKSIENIISIITSNDGKKSDNKVKMAGTIFGASGVAVLVLELAKELLTK